MKGTHRSDADEIKQRTNIVEIINDYVPLRKAGRNFLGLCPFHQERTPSFTVNPEKQIFYCFGCGEGGDVFSFLIKMNQMTFPEALRHLADKLGIRIAPPSGADDKRRTEKEQIIRVNRMAADFFRRNLLGENGRKAREYLAKRQIPEAVSETFRLGYAPDGWRNLRDFLEKQKVSPALAERAGLLILKGGNDYYDRFRSRLIFPIEDLKGQVIAFGGRSLGDEMPKYLNSPESAVYRKGSNLYGLNRTRDGIRKSGAAILVEGYFDVISLWMGGIRNALATLGTALTRDHLRVLRRFTGELVVLFDPDEGGRSGLERSLKLFLAEKMNAKIALLPEGKDPDELIRTGGRAEMEKQISGAVSLIDYYIDNIIGAQKGVEGKRAALNEGVGFIRDIEDVLQRNLFIKRVSERLGLDQELLKKEVGKAAAAAKAPAPARGQPKGIAKKLDRVELDVIAIMIEDPEKALRNGDVLSFFMDGGLRQLGEALAGQVKEKKGLNVSALLDRIDDGFLRQQVLKKVLSEDKPEKEILDRVFSDCVRKIRQRWYREQHKAIRRELLQAQERGEQEICKDLLLKKEQLIREEQAL